jgi:hypothetical protein
VNYVFTQFIEHLDQNGTTGNLTDILLATDPKSGTTDNAKYDANSSCHVIKNRSIPMLLVPPAHQRAVTSIINDLHVIVAEA